MEYSTPRPMMGNYHHPNAHRVLNEKIVYEEDVIGGSRHNHMHHHHPETHERVKVVEYEQVPERRVVYEEKVAMTTIVTTLQSIEIAQTMEQDLQRRW